MQYILCFAESIGGVEYAWVVAGDVTDVPRTVAVSTAVWASAVCPSSVWPSSVRPTSVVEELENLWTYSDVCDIFRTWELENSRTCELVVMYVNLCTWELVVIRAMHLSFIMLYLWCLWCLMSIINIICDICLYGTFIHQKQKKMIFLGTRQSGIPGTSVHSFVVCPGPGTRRSSGQRRPSPSRLRPRRLMLFIAVCLGKHTAKSFAVCPIYSTQRSQLCVAPSRRRSVAVGRAR